MRLPATSTRQMSEETPPGSTSMCVGAPRPARWRNAVTAGSLGCKPLEGPAGAVASIDETVVESVRAPLPELDVGWQDAISAPLRRTWRAVAIALFCLLHGALQHLAGGYGLALRARPRGEARAERTALVIGVGVGNADALDRAVDTDLALEGRPEKHQAGGALRFQLARLAARVVRIEDEAVAFDAFKQHHPRARLAVGADGGERHGVDQRQIRTQRILEPTLELPHRIAIHIGFREAGAHVFLAQIGDVHGGILRCEMRRPREIRSFSI